MPPKQKITKEMLLEHAFRIAEEQGIMAVTSRSVANLSGCSIQPVFSQFPTMEELRQATFDYACDIFVKEILAYEDRPDFFIQAVKWIIDLARNRPNLFRLLYLSDGFSSRSASDVLIGFESSRKMITQMMELFGLEESICKDILLRGCLFLMGICTMICVDHMEFSDEQVISMTQQTISDMVMGAKAGKGKILSDN